LQARDQFFDDQGYMTEVVATRVEALKTAHRKQQATQKALTALAKA
jgi:hypothetical protein